MGEKLSSTATVLTARCKKTGIENVPNVNLYL
jgi:hypothetical protein